MAVGLKLWWESINTLYVSPLTFMFYVANGIIVLDKLRSIYSGKVIIIYRITSFPPKFILVIGVLLTLCFC